MTAIKRLLFILLILLNTLINEHDVMVTFRSRINESKKEINNEKRMKNKFANGNRVGIQVDENEIHKTGNEREFVTQLDIRNHFTFCELRFLSIEDVPQERRQTFATLQMHTPEDKDEVSSRTLPSLSEHPLPVSVLGEQMSQLPLNEDLLIEKSMRKKGCFNNC